MNPMEQAGSNVKNKLWKCHGNDTLPYLLSEILQDMTLRHLRRNIVIEVLNLFHEAH